MMKLLKKPPTVALVPMVDEIPVTVTLEGYGVPAAGIPRKPKTPRKRTQKQTTTRKARRKMVMLISMRGEPVRLGMRTMRKRIMTAVTMGMGIVTTGMIPVAGAMGMGMTGALPAVQVTLVEEEEAGGRSIPTLAKQKQAMRVVVVLVAMVQACDRETD